jgi:hypothetical protein
MAEVGFDVPKSNFRKHTILGKPFDATQPIDIAKL